MNYRLAHEDILIYTSRSGEYKGSENIGEVVDYLQSQNSEFRLYNTRSQKEVFNLLWSQAMTLYQGKYVNSQGEHSSILVGAKGIGKSAALKIFASSIRNIIPNIIEVYVSFHNIRSMGNELASKSLAEVIHDRLRYHYYATCAVPEAGPFLKPLVESIVEMLDKLDVRLQLLVDEVDQMYKVDGKDYPSVVRTLNDLSYFANQPSGRIAVTICGSSALMEDLITTNAPESMRKDFVLLSTGATNLNGNKFITKRVYSSLPCDLATVASIAGYGLTEENKPWLRLVAFCTGCTARNVGRILKESDTVNAINDLACPERSLSGGGTLNSDENYFLLCAIMKLLVGKNRKLLKALFAKDSLDATIQQLSHSNWEETFSPLVFEEIQDEWSKLLKKREIDEKIYGNLSSNILHLADRNWISYYGVRHSRPYLIYPFTMLSLCNYYVASNTRYSQYAESFSQKIADGLKVASNPRVLVAEIRTVGVVAVAVTPFFCSCSIM